MTVAHGDGLDQYQAAIDQRNGGGTWVALGSFRFDAGQGPSVIVRSLNAGGFISADAVRFQSIPALPPLDVIVDNSDRARVNLVGNWATTISTPGFYGVNYVSAAQTNDKRVVYRPNLGRSGTMRISIWYPASPSRGTALVSIAYGDGSSSTVVEVDQRVDGGRWVSLGTYPWDAGTGPSVTVGCPDGGGWIGSGAVRFQECSVTTAN